MAISSRLRQWLRPLRHTPLHPQWFAFRDEARVKRWVHDRATGDVLDVGCAGGWARDALRNDCRYVGLDYPATASVMYGTRPQVFANAAELPFPSNTFDTILLLEVLEHVADPLRVLAEIARVLKPDGCLLLTMPFLYPLHDAPHDYQRYTAPGLARSVARAGMVLEGLQPRNTGVRAAGLLAAIACADGVLAAFKERRWRLVFTPLLICAIPLVNVVAWLCSPLSGTAMLAGGHSLEARKR